MADGELPALSVDDAARILSQMSAVVGDRSVVLVGGQAIALWGEQLKEYLPGDEEPVTSRDIDFQGSSSAVVATAALLGGTAKVATFDDHGPNAGVAVFSDHEGHTRVIDFLTAPYGLDPQDVEDSAIEVIIDGPDGHAVSLWVLHPERCLRSRVANRSLPSKQTALARAQLVAAVALVPAFGRFLLDEGADPRKVMNLNERVFELAYYWDNAITAYLDDDIDVWHAALRDERLPDSHRSIRLLQMDQLIVRRREHRRRARVPPG